MNQNYKEKDNLFKMKKNALYWLLGLIYAAFIGLQLLNVQAITDFNYNIHEIMGLPAFLATFIVPVLFLVYLYLSIKIIKKYGISSLTLKATIKSVLVILSLVIIFGIVGYQSKRFSTSGVYEIENKIQENSKYYIVLEDRKIRISRNEYNLIDENKKYMIGYVWNKFSPDIGHLEIIEPIIEKK